MLIRKVDIFLLFKIQKEYYKYCITSHFPPTVQTCYFKIAFSFKLQNHAGTNLFLKYYLRILYVLKYLMKSYGNLYINIHSMSRLSLKNKPECLKWGVICYYWLRLMQQAFITFFPRLLFV